MQITALPSSLTPIVAATACDSVCVHMPANPAPRPPQFSKVTRDIPLEMLARLSASAIRISNVEYFHETFPLALKPKRSLYLRADGEVSY